MKTIVIALALTASVSAEAARIYVDAGVAVPGNGGTWATAYDDLAAAIGAAQGGDSLWVAEGDYFGGFDVPAGIAVLGGFQSGDSTLLLRSVLGKRVNLDGQSTSRVLTLGSGTVVDGCVIQFGMGSDPGGGGCLVTGTDPTIRNCFFRENRTAEGLGTALRVVDGGAPLVENSIFVDNKGSGHCVAYDSSGGQFVHNVIHDNHGNGLHWANEASIQVFNSSFTSNTGRGVCHEGFSVQPVALEACDFFANMTSHFFYQGNDLPTIEEVNALPYALDNIDVDPEFADPPGFDFMPLATSGLIDAGKDSPTFTAIDFDFALRPIDTPPAGGSPGIRDIGALEFGSAPTAVTTSGPTIRPELRLFAAPSPFRDATFIALEVDRATALRLVVVDARGRRVRTLATERVSSGRHTWTWDGRNEAGGPAAAGVYFVRARGDRDGALRRVVLLR